MSAFLAQMTKVLGVQGRYITVTSPKTPYGQSLVKERLINNLADPRPMCFQLAWPMPVSTAYLEIEPGWYVSLSYDEANPGWMDYNTPCHCASDGTVLRADQFSGGWEVRNVWTTLDIPVVEVIDCGDDDYDDEAPF